MSDLVGKRVQIVLTLGTNGQGQPAFDLAATEIDGQTLKQINPHAAMNMVHRAMAMYIGILQNSLPQQEEPMIVVPTGPMSNLRGN
jgi:hypothetical protein